jgi:hypothetical protein
LALAALCGRQAAFERRDTRTWTHISLQLQTLKAFIADLDPMAQAIIQQEFAMRLFPGQSQDPHGDSKASDPTDIATIMQIIKAAQGTKPPGA